MMMPVRFNRRNDTAGSSLTPEGAVLVATQLVLPETEGGVGYAPHQADWPGI